MAALRGARDVESLLWIDKYCTNGVGISDNGHFHTHMIKIYVVDEGEDGMMQIVRGFKVCTGVGWFCVCRCANWMVLARADDVRVGVRKVSRACHRQHNVKGF